MRKRRLRGGITALSVLAAIGMASGITAFAADDTQSEAVDTGKGLEYVYESSGSTPSGVTLNGNSVIIKQSPNSTDSEQLFNIYNDKDRDGILDEGEEAFTLDGSTDIQYGNIYGIYHGKGSSPISITIDGAELPAVYGAFESTVWTFQDILYRWRTDRHGRVRDNKVALWSKIFDHGWRHHGEYQLQL